MSTTRDEDDDLEPADHPDLPDRAEGATELSFRESLLVLFYDPDVRNYTIAVLSSLAMIFLVLFTQNSDIGGALIGLVGVAGVLFRWTAAPPLILLLLTYFMIFPFGVPLGAEWKLWEIEDGRFRPLDVILAASVMVYVVSHYRLICTLVATSQTSWPRNVNAAATPSSTPSSAGAISAGGRRVGRSSRRFAPPS